MTMKTTFNMDIAAPLVPRAMPDFTGPGKSWMKETSGAFLARASRDKVDERAGVAALGEQGDLPTLEVGRVDWGLLYRQ
jgi:hypothetical protein